MRKRSSSTPSMRNYGESPKTPFTLFAVSQRNQEIRKKRNLNRVVHSPANTTHDSEFKAIEINSILTKFETELSVGRVELAKIKSSVKALKELVTRMGRLSHVRQEYLDDFWNQFESIKTECRSATKSYSNMNHIAEQLKTVTINLATFQERAGENMQKQISDLIHQVETTELEIRAQKDAKGMNTILTNLRRLQALMPDTRTSQTMTRVILSLQSARESMKAKASMDALIMQTDTKLKEKVPREAAHRPPVGRKSIGMSPKSLVSSNENLIVMTRSRRASSPPAKINRRVSTLSFAAEKLQDDLGKLEDEIAREEKREGELRKRLETITREHSRERKLLQKQLSNKVSKSMSPGQVKLRAAVEELEQKEQLLRAKLSTDGDTESTDGEFLREKIRLIRDDEEFINDELARVKNIHKSLLANGESNMEVKLDDQILEKETKRMEAQMKSTYDAIKQLHSVREQDFFAGSRRALSKEERSIISERYIAENEELQIWKEHLTSELAALNAEYKHMLSTEDDVTYTRELRDAHLLLRIHRENKTDQKRTQRAPRTARNTLSRVNNAIESLTKTVASYTTLEKQIDSMRDKTKIRKSAETLAYANISAHANHIENANWDSEIKRLYEQIYGDSADAPATDLYMRIQKYASRALLFTEDSMEFENERQRKEFQRLMKERSEILNGRGI